MSVSIDAFLRSLDADMRAGRLSEVTRKNFITLVGEHNTNTSSIITIENDITIVSTDFGLEPRYEPVAGASMADLGPGRTEMQPAAFGLEPV